MAPFTMFLLSLVLTVSVSGAIGYWWRGQVDRRQRDDLSNQLADEVQELQEQHSRQIAELQERLDFTERVVAQQRPQLPVEAHSPTPV